MQSLTVDALGGHTEHLLVGLSGRASVVSRERPFDTCKALGESSSTDMVVLCAWADFQRPVGRLLSFVYLSGMLPSES